MNYCSLEDIKAYIKDEPENENQYWLKKIYDENDVTTADEIVNKAISKASSYIDRLCGVQVEEGGEINSILNEVCKRLTFSFLRPSDQPFIIEDEFVMDFINRNRKIYNIKSI